MRNLGAFFGAGATSLDAYGGALYAGGTPGPLVLDCEFVENDANFGGAVYCRGSIGGLGSMSLVGCRFEGNRWWGAVHCAGASVTIEGCSFARPWDDIVRPLVVSGPSMVSVTNTTLRGYAIGVEVITSSSTVGLTRCIIADGTPGPAMAIEPGAVISLSCCDLFGNAGGDWAGEIAGFLGVDGNFSADSRFCASAEGDLSLAANSPCLPGNHPGGASCDLIGAFGQGCPPTAVDATSWGAIKRSFGGRAVERSGRARRTAAPRRGYSGAF